MRAAGGPPGSRRRAPHVVGLATGVLGLAVAAAADPLPGAGAMDTVRGAFAAEASTWNVPEPDVSDWSDKPRSG